MPKSNSNASTAAVAAATVDGDKVLWMRHVDAT